MTYDTYEGVSIRNRKYTDLRNLRSELSYKPRSKHRQDCLTKSKPSNMIEPV